MAAWAKPVLAIGVLSLLVGFVWTTFALGTCQELSPDLQLACWGALRWDWLLVPIAVGAAAVAVSLLGVRDCRRLGWWP